MYNKIIYCIIIYTIKIEYKFVMLSKRIIQTDHSIIKDNKVIKINWDQTNTSSPIHSMLYMDELIYKCAGFCSFKDLMSISYVNKKLNKLRLWRLSYGKIIESRWGSNLKEALIFINQLNAECQKETYSLNFYLNDLYYSIFNELINFQPRKFRKFSNTVKHSSNLIQIIRNNYKITKGIKDDIHKLTKYPRCHEMCRVNPVVYNHLRRFHLNVLALIY